LYFTSRKQYIGWSTYEILWVVPVQVDGVLLHRLSDEVPELAGSGAALQVGRPEGWEESTEEIKIHYRSFCIHFILKGIQYTGKSMSVPDFWRL
jgi:hypothetical protein